MVTESTAPHTPADTLQLEARSWGGHLACLDGFQWTCLASILASAVLRDTRGFQWRIGQTWVTVHLIILVFLAVCGAFRLLTSGTRNMTAGLFVSGCLFCIYGFAIDSLRAFDFLGPLAVDLAFVGCPIIVAIAFLRSESPEDDESALLVLCVFLAGIMLLYMGVAFFAYSLNVGDLVGPRYRNLENLSFARISGPLGGATSLCLVTIPAISFLYLRAKAELMGSRTLWVAIWLLILASAWTVSRVGIVLLLLLLAIQFPKRRVAVACLVFLAIALALNWGPGQLPEKWLRMGVSDPGRVDALSTTFEAVQSNKQSLLTGVGSHRLNIITQTAAAVSRGDLSFTSWATEFGNFPYGPHSIILWALGSYGMVGVILRCWFLPELYISGATFSAGPFPWAVILSSSCLYLDDTHILYPFLMTIWFIFYLYSLRLARSARDAAT